MDFGSRKEELKNSERPGAVEANQCAMAGQAPSGVVAVMANGALVNEGARNWKK